MSADSIPEPERLSWSFDAVRFGTAIAQRRTALGLSTRDLARLAAISQSYVVALERSRLRGDGPTPTIDVVARLASALGLSPTDLFHGGLRRTSTHVLLVVDDLRRATMPSVLRAAPEGTERWLLVGSDTSHAAGAHHTFDLDRGRRQAYEPARIEQSLRRQLGQIGDDLHQRGIGFVFDETSTAMQKFHAHDAVVAFEHSWADVVDGAASSVGGHCTWNVCVYALDHLLALPDPFATTVELMRTHHTTWSAQRQQVDTGRAAARSVLQRLKPFDMSHHDWTAQVERTVDEISFAA